MIRTETEDGWFLITHPDHAKLAGHFADAWGNEQFPKPEPFSHVREAVYAHDNGWLSRDANPMLTRQGRPSAFSRELVGTYSAFEEIDLADYLAVRGRALDAVAERDPFAAVVISMHTVNLLTEQADLSTIRPEDRPLHANFVEGQRARQRVLADSLQAQPEFAGTALAAAFERAFRFLQCCDSFSLIACVSYHQPRRLRHAQTTADGGALEILCSPEGQGAYRVAPWPFRTESVNFSVQGRRVPQKHFSDLEAFRATYAESALEDLEIRLTPG